MSVEAFLAALVVSSVLASAFFTLTRVLDAVNGRGTRERALVVVPVKAKVGIGPRLK